MLGELLFKGNEELRWIDGLYFVLTILPNYNNADNILTNNFILFRIIGNDSSKIMSS